MANLVECMKIAALEAMEAAKPCAVMFGIVQSVSPLKVNIEQKLTLDAEQLILTRNVTDYKTKISFDNPSIKQEFTTCDMGETSESQPSKISFKQAVKHDITVYNGLSAGDRVIMVRMQEGQRFLVLDRAV